jgi:anti-sigma regulatory factor (Ser/Thr protein kinase)
MDSTDDVHVRFLLPDRTYQAVVRAELRRLAESAGFQGHRLGEIDIIIAEITSNLIKHAAKGGMILGKKISGSNPGIEFIAIDEGPGMRHSAKMMEDGKSTTKTLGQGLGAIRRLSDEFDLFSMHGWGTIVFSRIHLKKNTAAGTGSFDFNVIRVPKKDHTLCGDSWSLRLHGNKIKIALIDGLGHGMPAHTASTLAVQSMRHYVKLQPNEELRSLHEDIKKTRGAVITIAHLDKQNNQLVYSGVGNISMKIVTPIVTKGWFSYNGIVGHIMPTSLNNHNFIWNEKTDMLIMHSDGIATRWDIQNYPGILQHHPMILAAALYRDFDRGNDDSTILIGKMLK